MSDLQHGSRWVVYTLCAFLATTSALAQDVTVAAVGDLIYLRSAREQIEKQAPKLVQVLREADVTFGNFEASSFALTGFKGSPQIKSSGPLVLAWPGAGQELKALGFKMLSHANNHTFDFGGEGALATDATLHDAGLVHAGSGANLHEARAARYFAANGKRAALIAATATFQVTAPAADAFGPIPAHAGVSALRTTRIAHVDAQSLEALRRIAGTMPRNSEDTAAASPNGVRVLGQNFEAGTGPLSFQMNPTDAAEIIAAVRESKRSGGLSLLSLHTHEPTTDVLSPADFAVELAHQAIDAGADAFLGHGAHQMRGIEIYQGKPIFYSLGNFAVMLPTPELNPGGFALQVKDGKVVAASPSIFSERAFFESVIAVSRYKEGKLVEVQLHPFELAITGDPRTHGLPQAVTPEAGKAILERLQQLSQPFGTRIVIENGIGVIKIKS